MSSPENRPDSARRELTGWRREFHLKLRFGLSKLPIFPAVYRLRTSGQPDMLFRWTRVMPFMNPVFGAFNYELYGWDVRELRFLRRWLRPGINFLDVGAHHGLYSTLASRLVQPSGKVLALEPSPSVIRRLKWHLRLNGAHNVVALPIAAGSEEAILPLHLPSRGIDTVSHLLPNRSLAPNVRTVDVQVKTLDSIAANQCISPIDIIKLDVEGAESEVLLGAEEIVRKNQPVWLFEALDDTSRAWGQSGRTLVSRFEGIGCQIFEFSPEGFLLVHKPRSEYPIDSNCNLLAVPDRHRGSIDNLVITTV